MRNVSYEWRLAFAGAFTGDGLTDPVFFLEDDVQNADAPPEEQTHGFRVRQSRDAEDSYSLGAAAMIHLFHSDPTRLDFRRTERSDATGDGPSAGLLHWAPLSFGLGVGTGSDTRYYLGTSLRFGQRAYLTAGWVFGSRDRLPNGLDVGSFTTDSNALGSLGTKTSSAFFVGLSFDFLTVGASEFMGPFQTAKPELAEQPTAASEEQGNAEAPEGPDEQVLAQLNDTGDGDLFKGDQAVGLFKTDFKGLRFCEVKTTESGSGTTVKLNLKSLVDEGVATAPEKSADLQAKHDQIVTVVQRVVAGHYNLDPEEVKVALDTCSQ